MFTSDIYESWYLLQKEKYGQIFSIIGTKFLRGKILDVGAGHGWLRQFLKDRVDVICLEIDRKMIKNGMILGRGEESPIRKESIDVLFCLDALHLIEKLDTSCLKKDGMIIASTFFNEENFEEKREKLQEKLQEFKIEKEFIIETKEKEIVVVARK